MSTKYRGTGSNEDVLIDGNPVTIINLTVPWVQCCLCGIDCPSTHGVPVSGLFHFQAAK